MAAPAQMKINLFLAASGYHYGAWRRPNSRAEELLSLELLCDLTLQAERAKLDAVFLADNLQAELDSVKHPRLTDFEPLTLLSALAARTTNIGLIGSASTTFSQPFNLARQFAALDHLSAGRAGWNLVTSIRGAQNFGGCLPSHSERYEQAAEFVDAVHALWDSWSDDAVVTDRAAGIWARPDRVRLINHHGSYYDVAGPLNVPRPPQGHPVLVQAGASDTGRDFAATHAEMVFTATSDINAAQEFYTDMKKRVARAGRDPESVKILPGFMPIVGATEDDANRFATEMADFVDAEVGMAALKWQLDNAMIEDLPLDEPIPTDRLTDPDCVEASRARYEMFYRLAVEQKYTLRQLIQLKARSSGHAAVIGTAEQVAEHMIEWFTNQACDGSICSPRPYRTASTTSSTASCRSCVSAVTSAATTPAAPCGSISDSPAQITFSAQVQVTNRAQDGPQRLHLHCGAAFRRLAQARQPVRRAAHHRCRRRSDQAGGGRRD
jgi:FMN-dependent oxidoreductase (nitrilotriacetate monooxygenase family)